jgi:hypothetical protein
MNKQSKWKIGNIITKLGKTFLILKVGRPSNSSLGEPYYLVFDLKDGATSYYSEFALNTWALRN